MAATDPRPAGPTNATSLPDRVREETRIVGAEPSVGDSTSTHVRNWLECLRSRQQPRATVDAGFSHAVAGIMSSEALRQGRVEKAS